MPDKLIESLRSFSPTLTALVTSLFGFLGGFLVFRNKKRPEDRVDFQVLLQDYKEQVDLLRIEVATLRKQVMQLIQERDDCKQEIELLKLKHLKK